MVTQIKTPSTKTIPYIREFPLIGSQYAFRHDRLNFLLHVAQQGDVCGFHVGLVPIILFNKPEHVQSILVEHASDFIRGQRLRKAIAGNGLLIAEGEFHRQQRKLMAPLFQPRYLASYSDTMTQYGERFQQQWSDGVVIDLHREMINLVVNILGKVLFDMDSIETDELVAAIAVTFARSTYVLSSPFAFPLNWPTPHNRRFHKAKQYIRDLLQRIITERLNSTTEHNDLISLLLRARYEDGSRMSDQQIMAECWTLLTAGHETTAVALIWVWYLLCQHPEVYERVQQEVDSVLEGQSPTYDDLPRLPYCLQVFKEAMRLYSPAPAVRREALRDVEIDGYLLPKDATVLVSPYTMHRRPEYFPQPEQFDPERFSPEREKDIPRYAYFPFGGGPRVCIGNHFSMLEGHLLLATLAQRMTFTLVPGQTIRFDIENTLTLRPKGKVEVIVKKR
ncbi:MAG: cytochrome P450 [Ktedonobacteraceae bacterium]|nr:cytochrome P450 [Ktedonobacteraceae bacterium]